MSVKPSRESAWAKELNASAAERPSLSATHASTAKPSASSYPKPSTPSPAAREIHLNPVSVVTQRTPAFCAITWRRVEDTMVVATASFFFCDLS